MGERILEHWRLLLFVVIIAAAAMLYTYPERLGYLAPHSLVDFIQAIKAGRGSHGFNAFRTHILSQGWSGILLFTTVYTVAVTLGLPNLPFQLAAGAIYGLWLSFLMMFLGANIGALCAFGLARSLGRRSVERWLSHDIGAPPRAEHRLAKVKERLEREGFKYLLILRLTPLVPFNLINYISGTSRVRANDFVAAGLLGMGPLTFIHVAIGHALRLHWS